MAETKKAPNQIVRLALVLFLVSAIVSGVLGFVNMLTKDRIKELEEQARAEAYNAVLPWDGEYTDVAYDKEAFQTVDAVAQAGDEGWVVELTFSGAQSSISAAFGVPRLQHHRRERHLPRGDFRPRREDCRGGLPGQLRRPDRGHGRHQGRRHGGFHNGRDHLRQGDGQRRQHGHSGREIAGLRGALRHESEKAVHRGPHNQ